MESKFKIPSDKEIDEYFVELERKMKIEENQLKRFHNRFGKNAESFSFFVEKVLEKYSSDGYRDRWYNRGIEPQETLLFFLYDYASQYSEEVSIYEDEDEDEEFYEANEYTIFNYTFELIHGQGSIVLVTKNENI